MLPETRRSLLAVAILTTAFSAISCGREPTGPGGAGGVQYAQGFSLLAQFPQGFEELRREAQSAPSGSGDLVAFTKVRVILRNPNANNAIVLEQVVDFPAGTTELPPLTLSVPLPPDSPAGGMPLRLTLEYLTATNAIVFSGGPVTVTAVPVVQGQGPPAPAQITIPITYTGPGANATGIRFSAAPTTVNTNQAFTFVAQATDATGNVIANVPILYNSLNPLFASINAATGAGTAGPSRGSVSIEAKLLTGPAVIAQLAIVSPPASLAAVRGSGQIGPIGAPLAGPVEVRVTASDGGPAPGVTVTFAAQNGGSVGNATIVTDPNGLAATTWRLGSTVGTQTLTAAAAGLTGSPVTFTATGRAIDPVRLVFGQQPPTSAAAGTSLAPAVTVHAVDATGAVTTAFGGTIIVALAPGAPAGAALTGTLSATAAAGVATFPDLKLNIPGSYTLVATTSNLTAATSNPFAIVAGAANRLAFQQYPVNGARAGAQLDPVTVVVRDGPGNPVAAFTGEVTLAANGPTAAAAGSQTLPAGVNRVGAGSGEQANALLGTTTVFAVAGVATFSDIRLTSAGGYTFTASASGLVTANSPQFTITPGPASSLVLVGGSGQIAAGGATLTSPIVVKVTDGFGNGVGGITVNFAPTAGHGSVNPGSAVTAIDGTAQTLWTLAGAAGTKTLNVTGTGLTPNPLIVSATATTGSGTVRTWTGVVSSAFNIAGNWTPVGVPGSADQLTIPAGGTAPVNTGTITVGSLALNSGATLDNSGSITVNGTVSMLAPANRDAFLQTAGVIGSAITGNGQLILAGPVGSSFVGNIVNQVIVSGSYALGGATMVSNALQVVSGGTLALNGFSLYVDSDFYTVGTGKIVMSNSADYLHIEGNANFGGGSTHGFLTAGTLEVEENFTATGATFSATGSHLTLFSGNDESTQNIAFTSPVAGRGFNHVRFESYDEKSFSGSPTILGNVEIDGSSGLVTGDGITVKVGGNLSDYTYVAYDTQGAWRVGTTDFFGSGTINSQFLSTEVIISGGTRMMAPYDCGICEVSVRAGGTNLGGRVRGAARAASQAPLQDRLVDAGYAQINGSILITGASSVLDLNSTELYVFGSVTTASGGKLKMTDANDYLYVESNATFGGGSTAGLLTAGELEVIGSFTQGGGAADAFAPTTGFYTYIGDPYCYYCGVRAPNAQATRADRGAVRQQSLAEQARAARHAADAQRFEALRAPMRARRDARTASRAAVLNARRAQVTPLGRQARPSPAVRTNNPGVRRVGGLANEISTPVISFANPGSSAFGQLYLQGNNYELNSNVNVLGRLETGGGYDFYMSSATPRTITSHGADVRELHFSNVRWALLDGDEVTALDNVSFDDMDPTVDQFSISRNGDDLGASVTGYTLWYWDFGTTPTTGRYINANDSNGAVPFLQLNMYSPSPATHGGKVVTSGGALINNWVAAFFWTGLGLSNIWGDYSNWSTGFPPTSNDDVTIPAGTPFNPRVNSYGATRNLTVASGVTIQIDGQLSVYGNLDAPIGSTAFPCSTGSLHMYGSFAETKFARGWVCNINMATQNFQVGSGNQLIADSYLTVIDGDLTLAGGQLHVGGPNGAGAGTLNIINDGTLTMTNSADRLFVGSGGASWSGGSSAGRLTAGILTMVGGRLFQAAGAADAFAPSGAFSTIWTGSNHVTFASPGSSFFNDLTVTAGSTLELYTNALVQGTLTRGSGAADASITASFDFTLTVRGLNIAGANLTRFSRVHLKFEDGQPGALFSNVKFENFPVSHTGIFFEVARATGPLTFSALDFSGQSVGTGGRFVRNSGAANVTITGSNPATGTLNGNFDKTGAGGISWP